MKPLNTQQTRCPDHWDHSAEPRGRSASASGFSMVELLVVIAIIALLAGILLVALNAARNKALETDTVNTMQSFRAAAESFNLEHGRYPGVIPEEVITNNPSLPLSTTENALLDLMGGYRVLPPGFTQSMENAYDAFVNAADPINLVEITFGSGNIEWQLAVDISRIGEGPVIDGKSFSPYFTPDEGQVLIANHPPNDDAGLPDLVDAWGQPILYVRQRRDRGPLVPPTSGGGLSQFLTAGMEPYVLATELGELGNDQTTSNPNGSVFADPSAAIRNCWLQRLLEHPSLEAQSRGAFILISAGKDGIYLSGASAVNCDDIDEVAQYLDDADDVRIYGGG